jgi:hypothetical protein
MVLRRKRLYRGIRCASLVPYALTAELLAHMHPIGSGVNATTVRQHVVWSDERTVSDLAQRRALFAKGAGARDCEDRSVPDGRERSDQAPAPPSGRRGRLGAARPGRLLHGIVGSALDQSCR